MTRTDMRHAIRDGCSKDHGLLPGEAPMLDSLPPALAQGLPAKPATYPVATRVSTLPVEVLDDRASTRSWPRDCQQRPHK